MKYNVYDTTYNVRLVRAKYQTNGNLAIRMLDEDDGSPVATLTVNLCPLADEYGENYAFVDTNNNPTAREFIEDNKLGEWVGVTKHSGFCEYPLYRFDLSKLEDK